VNAELGSKKVNDAPSQVLEIILRRIFGHAKKNRE
jgi:hypothetical protein